MTHNPNVYGCVNGKPVFSRDEFIFEHRKRGPIEDDARCTVEVTVYRLNAVAVTAFLLDGPETLLRHIGLDEQDTYTTKHEIDDLVTVVHITREEAPAWQH